MLPLDEEPPTMQDERCAARTQGTVPAGAGEVPLHPGARTHVDPAG